jgi:hypothetical protein
VPPQSRLAQAAKRIDDIHHTNALAEAERLRGWHALEISENGASSELTTLQKAIRGSEFRLATERGRKMTLAEVVELRKSIEEVQKTLATSKTNSDYGPLIEAVDRSSSNSSVALTSLRDELASFQRSFDAKPKTDLLSLLISTLGPAATFMIGFYFGPKMTERLEQRKYSLVIWEQFLDYVPEIEEAQRILRDPLSMTETSLARVQRIRAWMNAVAGFAMSNKVVDGQLIRNFGLQAPMRHFLDCITKAEERARRLENCEEDVAGTAKWAANELQAEAEVSSAIRVFIES